MTKTTTNAKPVHQAGTAPTAATVTLQRASKRCTLTQEDANRAFRICGSQELQADELTGAPVEVSARVFDIAEAIASRNPLAAAEGVPGCSCLWFNAQGWFYENPLTGDHFGPFSCEENCRGVFRQLQADCERMTLPEAIDAFPILQGYRSGIETTSDGRAYMADDVAFRADTVEKGTGARMIATTLASLAGYDVERPRYTLGSVVAHIDSEHRRALADVLCRFIHQGGF